MYSVREVRVRFQTTLRVVLVALPVSVAAPIASAQTSTLIYGLSGSGTPRMRTWTAGTWSAESNLPSMGSETQWVVVKECPTRTELIAAVLDSSKVLRVSVHNGTSWGSATTLSTDTVIIDARPFDLAYESSSGDAVVVYAQGSGNPQYRVWNGTAWSGASAMPNGSEPVYIRLASKPGSDEIVFGVVRNSLSVGAAVWSGSAWGSSVSMSHSVYTIGDEAFDLAYESTTGRCMIAWASASTSAVRYRIWTGAAWAAEAASFSTGSAPLYIRLAPRPGSAMIVGVTLDNDEDINAGTWNGSAWGGATEIENVAGLKDRRCFDAAWEPGGTRLLVVQRKANGMVPHFHTFDGSTWSSDLTGPNVGGRPEIVRLAPVGSGTDILVGIDLGPSGLCTLRWTGSALGSLQSIAGDLGGSSGSECFAFTPEATGTGTGARILEWRETDPWHP